MYHYPSGDKLNVFSCIQHPCQVIDCSIRIRTPHALNKRRNGIIVIISALIITDSPLLNTFLGHIQINMNPSVAASARSQDSQFHRIEGGPGVPVGHIGQKLHGVVINPGIIAPHALFFIIHSPLDQLFYILFFKSFEFKNPAAGKQSAIHLKVRILRSRPDQDQGSVFHEGEQVILLAFIEPVNLVHKQNGFPPIHSQGVLCLSYHFFHILFSCHCSVDLTKIRLGGIRDNFGKGGLSCSRRAVENNRPQLISLNGTVQQFIFSDNMFLSHHFIQ